MSLAKRVVLLRLRKTLPVVEAAYIVEDKLGGMWDDAVSLLTEAIDAGDLMAQIVPKRNPWQGTIIGPVDESQTTVAMADLLPWLDGIARAAPIGNVEAEIVGTGKRIKRVPLPADQEAAILAEIRRRKVNPLALPERPNGKRGWRADIGDQLCQSRPDLFYSRRAFHDAWQRGRDDEKIIDRTG